MGRRVDRIPEALSRGARRVHGANPRGPGSMAGRGGRCSPSRRERTQPGDDTSANLPLLCAEYSFRGRAVLGYGKHRCLQRLSYVPVGPGGFCARGAGSNGRGGPPPASRVPVRGCPDLSSAVAVAGGGIAFGSGRRGPVVLFSPFARPSHSRWSRCRYLLRPKRFTTSNATTVVGFDAFRRRRLHSPES